LFGVVVNTHFPGHDMTHPLCPLSTQEIVTVQSYR